MLNVHYAFRFLIGRNGANIRKIRELTGARIVFPSDTEANNTKERDVITIVGREDAVKKAREELENRIKELVIKNIHWKFCDIFILSVIL